ncbi:MAG: zinc ribbon domain-containing protein [Porticoccaceae bacterium]|jgi:uncharacterized OB-fold protein
MSAKFKTMLASGNTLRLQRCDSCGQVNYPVRELCGGCLGDSLTWQSVDDRGTVQTLTALHYPLEKNFSSHLPWRIASVKLDAGPVAFAHLQLGIDCEARVRVSIVQDEIGNSVLVATGENESANQWLRFINFTEITP